jgi:L-ascorbate metabolism protein UlaG (beta-lactamase superfamily)
MQRRHFLRYAPASLITLSGAGLMAEWQPAQAQSALTVRWLGHTCFLFTGDGQTLLSNPFKPVGCTANYRSITTNVSLVMISSQLLDEGYIDDLPGDPKLLFDPGIYRINNLQIQGIPTDHDLKKGRRFGTNLTWKWTQGGVKILHLGGAAAPITLEQQILMGQPDLLLIPVGGGPKAYSPEAAKQAVDMLKPKAIIPTHYRTAAADPTACDLVEVDQFLSLMSGTPIKKPGTDTLVLSPRDLSAQDRVVYALSYKF